MTRQRPVGTAEREVLQGMELIGGEWHKGNAPLWESEHWTLTLLRSLAVKGYVEEVVPDGHYRLNGLGMPYRRRR